MARMQELLKQVVGVEIEIDGVNYPNEYADALVIDRSDLDAEFVEHSERYAYYATLAELADDRADRLKEKLEHLAAVIDHEKRDAAKAMQLNDPKFKMTEAMFEHEVKMDPRYQRMLEEFQDARHLAKVLKSAPLAFAHRRDMLLELGRSRMSQLTDPRVLQNRQQVARNLISQHSETQEQDPGTVQAPAPTDNTTPRRREPRKA